MFESEEYFSDSDDEDYYNVYDYYDDHVDQDCVYEDECYGEESSQGDQGQEMNQCECDDTNDNGDRYYDQDFVNNEFPEEDYGDEEYQQNEESKCREEYYSSDEDFAFPPNFSPSGNQSYGEESGYQEYPSFSEEKWKYRTPNDPEDEQDCSSGTFFGGFTEKKTEPTNNENDPKYLKL